MPVTAADQTERIRELNDRFRTTFTGGVVLLTQGVEAMSADVKVEILRRVRTFNAFDRDNDPHREHDFGSFEIEGQKFFFKVDYYDRDMERGSEDPADTDKTTRVLTVMKAEEY
jgi:hypothetical protein